MTLTGEPSIQNGLEMALQTLRMIPAHASREVLLILGSLTTCDPGNISDTIQILKQENIRSSVISLSAETRIMKHLTAETHGIYSAILDETHFKDQLFQHIEPLQATNTQECSLIKMGFPHGIVQDANKKETSMMSMCMCHLDASAMTTESKRQISISGYYCPQCQAKYCELPVECVVCGLTLVLAPHLARSYHHLFPIANFIEVPNTHQSSHCFGCQKLLHDSDKNLYKCPRCEKLYCIDCDIFIHDTLHTCVGCSALPQRAQFNNNYDGNRENIIRM
jgi:transcription initiation factor TFIIH subunit 2